MTARPEWEERLEAREAQSKFRWVRLDALLHPREDWRDRLWERDRPGIQLPDEPHVRLRTHGGPYDKRWINVAQRFLLGVPFSLPPCVTRGHRYIARQVYRVRDVEGVQFLEYVGEVTE